jgi:hypothetical protein
MHPRERGHAALRQADRAAKRGDLVEAERWTKLAREAAAQYERLNAAPPPSWEDNIEETRAELLRRLTRYAEFGRDVSQWELERNAYIAIVKEARKTGAPMPPPLRMHPAGPTHNPEPHLVHLLQGPEPDDGK